MQELLVKYSLSEIVIFIVVLAFAVKEVITFIDWGCNRLKKVYDKDYELIEERKRLEGEIKDLSKLYNEQEKVNATFAKIDQTFEKINKRIDMLIESDKEDIKAYVTEKHHFFVYHQGWVDDYSLECLERKFAIYQQEHGNSFVEGLMDEVRALPKQPPEADAQKYIGTAEFVKIAKAKH